MSTVTSSLGSRTPSPPPTTPASTPPSGPELQQQQQHPEQPSAGQIWFMPSCTPVMLATQEVYGKPGNHPVLVLPALYPSVPFDRVLFLTTIDVVQRCVSKKWATNYLPIEEQIHPFRDPVSLATGSATLRLPSSVNVGCVYTIPKGCLRELNFKNLSSGAPTLSEAAMETVLHYVAGPCHDQNAPWKPHAKQYRPVAAAPAPLVSVAAPIVAAPVMGLIAGPVAAVATYASVATNAPIVVVEAPVSPQNKEVNGTKRKLSPRAQEFRPFVKQRVHPAYSNASWRPIH